MTEIRAPIDPQELLAHGDFVRAIARSLLWDEHAAEDVVQQTWLAALGLPATASRGWLGAVARNLAIKRLRGDRRRGARELAASRQEAGPSPAEVLERERLRRSVVEEVLALPEPYRATVLLRYFEDLPPREIARRMAVPVETVRTRTRRAIETLRARLDLRHEDDRAEFCGALVLWASRTHRAPAPPAAPTGVGVGGIIMGIKTAVVGAAVVLAAIAAGFLWARNGASARSDLAAAAPSRSVQEVRPAVARGRALSEPPGESSQLESAQAAAPQSAKKPVLRGRIVDKAGVGVAGAMVIVSGEALREFPMASDAEGRFRLDPAEAGAATVRLRDEAMFDPTDGVQRDVTLPCDEIAFVVERRPTATLVITGWDVEASRPAPYVACDFGSRRVSKSGGRGGSLVAVVRLASPAGEVVHFVAGTDGGATGERDVGVKDGDRIEVRVELAREGQIRGRVVDASGRPLAEALVFLGEEHIGRGDEPFKPFEDKRVQHGVRTDADGQFELRGAGRWVTAWHADAGPITVARADASNVILPARGVLRGVLRGGDGVPLRNAKLYLDRVRETTTDSEGRFEFTNVEPGTRGLSLQGGKPKAYVAVRVAPGATVEAELRPGIPTVRVEWPGRTNLGRFVALLPIAAVGSLGLGQPSDGGFTVADLLPGRYLVLAEGCGVASVDVAGPAATAVVGTGEIVVHAKPKTRLWVVPENAGYLARLLAGRMAGAGVPEDGVQHVTGLAPGRYEVGVELDGIRVTVEVKDGPVDVTID
jgi:RNA polymerase sigma factor (sigma-70 family)